MTLDSSALVAILFSEAGHLDLVDRILDADAVRVAAPTLAETTIVVSARWREPGRRAHKEIREVGEVVIVPVCSLISLISL